MILEAVSCFTSCLFVDQVVIKRQLRTRRQLLTVYQKDDRGTIIGSSYNLAEWIENFVRSTLYTVCGINYLLIRVYNLDVTYLERKSWRGQRLTLHYPLFYCLISWENLAGRCFDSRPTGIKYLFTTKNTWSLIENVQGYIFYLLSQ